MSTHWGYVCRSHDPEIVSEHWWNHGDAALTDLYEKVRRGQWPVVDADEPRIGLVFEDEPYDALQDGAGGVDPELPQSGGASWGGPPNWLFQHPRCIVALHNEYGHYKDLPVIE